jgi:hypothetical protein
MGSFTLLGSGYNCKFLGSTENGELALTIAKTTTDTGLEKLLEKQGDNAGIAVSVTLSNGNKYAFHGLVKSTKVSLGGADEVVKINASIAINGDLYTL